VIQKYDAIAVEDLNVSGMSKGNLAKHVLDVSWAEWFRQLSYKAEWAGRMFVAVDPKYTSQTCAKCDHVSKDNRKTQELFLCVSCGHTDHADRNGAVNILARAELSDANVSGVTLCVV
jgi:putative transposase